MIELKNLLVAVVELVSNSCIHIYYRIQRYHLDDLPVVVVVEVVPNDNIVIYYEVQHD